MAPPPVIRLHPKDGVVIARATLLPGAPVADGVVAVRAHPGRAQGRCPPARRGRAGAPLRPDHRLRHAADRARRSTSMCRICGMGEFAQGLCLRRGREADRDDRPAGDLPGHPPRGWARRDAQLYRHADHA